jgi:hypothetical protein
MNLEGRDQVEAEKPYPQKCVNCIEVAAIAGVCWGCYRSGDEARSQVERQTPGHVEIEAIRTRSEKGRLPESPALRRTSDDTAPK